MYHHGKLRIVVFEVEQYHNVDIELFKLAFTQVNFDL